MFLLLLICFFSFFFFLFVCCDFYFCCCCCYLFVYLKHLRFVSYWMCGALEAFIQHAWKLGILNVTGTRAYRKRKNLIKMMNITKENPQIMVYMLSIVLYCIVMYCIVFCCIVRAIERVWVCECERVCASAHIWLSVLFPPIIDRYSMNSFDALILCSTSSSSPTTVDNFYSSFGTCSFFFFRSKIIVQIIDRIHVWFSNQPSP